MTNRIAVLRRVLAEQELDGVLVSKPESRRYFSGFTGSAGVLLITAGSAKFITDFRYIEQARQQSPAYQVVRHGSDLYETLAGEVRDLGIKKLGFEGNFVTHESYQRLAGFGVQLVSVQLDRLRMVKDETEIALIQKAVNISEQAMAKTLPFIRPGVRETDVAIELEFNMRKAGAGGVAFEMIVASGERSALPHGRASEKIIAKGDFVTIDFGAMYGGYCADITRTFVVGKADSKQKEIYATVLAAQLAGLTAVAPGKTGREVDAVARKIIADAGYADYFGHGLGHGLGLFIHEDPRLSPVGDIVLVPGMTVTVEPGIYLPGWGGVRIEDTVVVTADGARALSTGSKELIELDC